MLFRSAVLALAIALVIVRLRRARSRRERCEELQPPDPALSAWVDARRIDRRALKAEYSELFHELRACFFQHDPIGIDLGENVDEYDPEVGTVLPRLQSCGSATDVVTVLHEEFCKWFGAATAGPRERYEALAEDTWRIWSERRAQSVRRADR